MEGWLFDADTVEQGGGGDNNDSEADEVVGEEADRNTDKDEAQVGRVAYEAVQTTPVDLLFGADGDFDGKGSAEGQDGDPADREAKDDEDEREWYEPGHATEVCGRGKGSTPAGGRDAATNDEPEEKHGAAVLEIAAGVRSTGEQREQDFGGDPEIEQNCPEMVACHGVLR